MLGWTKLTISTLSVRTTYQEVVGLDVAVDEVLLMDGLYTSDLHSNMSSLFETIYKLQ